MIFCQRCKKANPGDVDYCIECGAFLMVISRPHSAAGFEASDSIEEHLLERISALESALTRANDRFEQLLEIRKSGRNVTVTLPGGDLQIEWRESDDHVLMTGPVEFEFEGRFDPALFSKVGAA